MVRAGGTPHGLLERARMTAQHRPLHLVGHDPAAEAFDDAAARLVQERDRYRAALLWSWSGDHCASGEVLLRAALGERGLGMPIEPPALQHLNRLVRLLRAMPWAREGLLPLGRDSNDWVIVGSVLCEAAGLPDPWLESPAEDSQAGPGLP
jgi:hypothetical protein